MKKINILLLLLTLIIIFSACSKVVNFTSKDLETYFLPQIDTKLQYVLNDSDTISIYCAEYTNKFEKNNNSYFEYTIIGLYNTNTQIGEIQFHKIDNNYTIKLFDIYANTNIEFFSVLNLEDVTLQNVYKQTNSVNKNEEIYFNKNAIYYLKNENKNYKLINISY